MTTRIDWHAELDASFGDGRDRPPTDFLGPGRTALRRRRTVGSAPPDRGLDKRPRPVGE